VQLVEVEQQTPYLESFAGVIARTATVSIIRRVSLTGTSSASYAQFDNHNGDGSRASFPLDVADGDTYGITAAFVRGPNFGVVQVSIDGRPLGAPFDGYDATLARAEPLSLGTLALSEGRHILTLTVTGKNAASTDYLAGLDLLVLDSNAAPVTTPTAVATAEVGGTVPATLALTLGAPATFAPFVPGVADEYTANSTATVTSSAADATLAVTDPSSTAGGHLVNGTRALPQALKVAGKDLPAVVKTWSDPAANDVVALEFKQAIGATDPLRTGTYAKTLTFTLSTTSP
jgi:hypothetical protein